MAPVLTKSLFVSGHQCLKQLWWKVREPDAVELQPDKVLQDLFDQGRQVGEIARTRFPNGTHIAPDERSARLEATRQAIESGATVLFEAAFEADGVFISADVLEKTANGWRLIEVKSSSSAKEEHVLDAGVQAHVLTRNGIELDGADIMHLNGDFRHPDVGELLMSSDRTEDVRAFMPNVPDIARRQLEILDGPLPTVDIGRHCAEPWDCAFKQRCWPDDDWHISSLYNCGPATFPKYIARGIHRIDQLPANEKLQFTQQRQIRALRTGEIVVEPTLGAALEPFNVEPLGFLDFETIMRAVPVWDGTKPWEQVAAQFSYHESAPGGTYRHEEYLAEGPNDCRPELARRLVDATRNAVRVVHYSSFEKTRIRALQQCVPELARELGELEAKLIDLLPVVRNNVYHRKFRGSFSIKEVLPALVPELSYNDLVIVDGRVASVEIARLLFVADRIPATERDRVRKDLLDYCERDTWATVRLVEVLRGLTASWIQREPVPATTKLSAPAEDVFSTSIARAANLPSRAKAVHVVPMTVPTIFDLCTPRDDVLRDAITESDYAADLHKVLRGTASEDYKNAGRFFANTYPTRGLKNLLHNVLSRVSGTGGEAASIFRLDTSFGGGKTHALIALAHAAKGMSGVPNISEFVNPALVPKPGTVKVAAFDGENADPSNGRKLEDGVLAKTPWGELAYALALRNGFERVRASDEQQRAPGAETIAELFENKPVLILLDELAIYLRKVAGIPHARDQFTAFLTDLFKAVESSPHAALVFTLAMSREGRVVDAYSEEQLFIADKFAELESVSARKATLLNPTEDDETVQVLRRRLFSSIDDSRLGEVVEAYRQTWAVARERLPADAQRPELLENLRSGYPFHPHVLETLTLKTATIANFQRVRGMLRLLARTIAQLWREKPNDATAIHLHHIDLGVESIRQELVTRLGLNQLVPALNSDVASPDAGHEALARALDKKHFGSLPPYGSYVGRTILIHTIAFNEPLKGATPDELRLAIAAPTLELSFVDQARQAFLIESAYLDDRPTAPMRFLTEANLNQVIRREEQVVDPAEARTQLKERIREIFKGEVLDLKQFPAGPFDLPDEIADGRPRLAVMSHDAVTVGGTVEEVPDIVARIFLNKGSDNSGIRGLRNHVVFVVADEARVDDMRQKMVRRLALRSLLTPGRLGQLAEHQQLRVRELEKRSEQELAIAIQQAFRHVFYPSRNRLGESNIDLGHLGLDLTSTSDSPGSGQLQVVRGLRDIGKLRLREDQPDAPAYVRDRTPLRSGRITTAGLRDEFRRDPALPILAHDDVFLRGVRIGIESGDFVYKRNDLVWGAGDPAASIVIDEQAYLYTTTEAKREGFWPRRDSGATAGPPSPSGGTAGRTTPPSVTPTGAGATIATGPGTRSFTAEGPLRQALTQIWQDARAANVKHIGMLQLRMFETTEAFKLISVMGTVAGSTKEVALNGAFESAEGGEFEFKFQGPISDATQLKAFLEPQFRAARDQLFNAAIKMTFDAGLSLAGRSAEELTDRLTRIASGAAHVQATAEGRA